MTPDQNEIRHQREPERAAGIHSGAREFAHLEIIALQVTLIGVIIAAQCAATTFVLIHLETLI